MSILNNKQAADNARGRTRNIPNTCQIVTRGYYGAPSVGDFDGDGAADAEDGWKAEPASAKRPGDRNPPEGMPVSWGGGSNDNGHRAISLGRPPGASETMIRSTDTPTRGVTSTVPLSWIEKNWGLPYLGWSTTISRIPIPMAEDEKPDSQKPTRITRTRRILRNALESAEKRGKKGRAAKIKKALEVLPKR